MSFAALAKILKEKFIVTAFDWRGHGANTQVNGSTMPEEVLIEDALGVITTVSGMYPENSIILVGHSMGGAIATKALTKIQMNMEDKLAKQIQGLFVIDVVEGSALEALPFMESIVMSRP